jgi:hypothetical protein
VIPPGALSIGDLEEAAGVCGGRGGSVRLLFALLMVSECYPDVATVEAVVTSKIRNPPSSRSLDLSD